MDKIAMQLLKNEIQYRPEKVTISGLYPESEFNDDNFNEILPLLKDVIELTIDYTDVTMIDITKLHNLGRLWLWENPLTKECIELLSMNLGNIIDLRITNCPTVKYFRGDGGKLQKIELSTCKLTNYDIQHILEVISPNTTMESIDFDENPITDSTHIIKYMHEHPTLHSISLIATKIDCHGVQSVIDAMRCHPMMRDLRMDRMRTADGVHDLTKADYIRIHEYEKRNIHNYNIRMQTLAERARQIVDADIV